MQSSLARIRASYERISAREAATSATAFESGADNLTMKSIPREQAAVVSKLAMKSIPHEQAVVASKLAMKSIPREQAAVVSKPAIIKAEAKSMADIQRIQPLSYPQPRSENPQPETGAVEELKRYISFDSRRYSQNMSEEGE